MHICGQSGLNEKLSKYTKLILAYNKIILVKKNARKDVRELFDFLFNSWERILLKLCFEKILEASKLRKLRHKTKQMFCTIFFTVFVKSLDESELIMISTFLVL